MNLDVGDVAEYLTQDILMDSIQVGKAAFGKEIYTTLGIEPRTYSYPGRTGNPYSVCWVKKPVQYVLSRFFKDI